MGIKVTNESIKEMLGSPTDISLVTAKDGTFSETAFNLYRETAIVAILVSNIYESTSSEEPSLLRNQAISVGLEVRIAKYMSAVLALMVDKVREHGEVIMALNRCITESAVNLKFFCEKAQQEDFDEFVKSSLKPERDLRKIILENIAKRGESLPIDMRMLNSIDRTFKYSGIENLDDLKKIPNRKDYKEILNILEMPSAYPMLQGIPSHAVHGTWVDLVLHHLEKSGSGFRPNSDAVHPDPRLLLPVSLLILYALQSYVTAKLPSDHDGINVLKERIKDLILRISKVDALHEQKLSKYIDPPTHVPQI